MLVGSCFVQLAAAMVVTFTGYKSMVNITQQGISNGVSSMVIQFKTSQLNTHIIRLMSAGRLFAINVQNGQLKIESSFNKTGNRSIGLGMVNTNKWFLLNITSQDNSTHIQLSENNNSLSMPCQPNFTTTVNTTLLGKEFSNLLKTTGLQIGGAASKGLESFQGCVGIFSLDNRIIDLVNKSKSITGFQRDILGVSKGCPCATHPCGAKGAFSWEETKGECECKCSIGYHGRFCQNRTMSKVPEDDEVDSEFIYIIVGVAVGVLVLLTIVVCVVLYIKRTSSSVFGVYNPKIQEQTQGQQMNMAFTLPTPEKLI